MKIFNLFLCLMICAGCAGHRASVRPETPASLSGYVIDPRVFNHAHTIFIQPFKPGPKASANEQTDAVSVELIKGIEQGLISNGADITIAKDAVSADLVMEGYVEEISKSLLLVDGDVWGGKNRVFTFSMNKQLKKKASHEMVASELGRSLGDFLASRFKQGADT